MEHWVDQVEAIPVFGLLFGMPGLVPMQTSLSCQAPAQPRSDHENTECLGPPTLRNEVM